MSTANSASSRSTATTRAAVEWLDRCDALAEACEHIPVRCQALGLRGFLALRAGDHAEARHWLRAALALISQHGQEQLLATLLRYCALLASATGRHADALRLAGAAEGASRVPDRARPTMLARELERARSRRPARRWAARPLTPKRPAPPPGTFSPERRFLPASYAA